LVKDTVISIKELNLKIESWEGERFVEVPDKTGRYLVSDKGRVYDTLKEKFCSLHNNGAGYYAVSLYVSGRKESALKYIHRLVAQHFIPNPEGKKFVNHIDHDKSNNCVENLEWVTAKENTAHGIVNGRINAKKRGKTNQISDRQRCRAVVLRKVGYGVNEVAQLFGLPRTTVSSVFNGRSNKELVDFIQDLCEDVRVEQLKSSLGFNKNLQETVDTQE